MLNDIDIQMMEEETFPVTLRLTESIYTATEDLRQHRNFSALVNKLLAQFFEKRAEKRARMEGAA